MHLSAETIADQRTWVLDRADVVVPLINRVRTGLGEAFDVSVSSVADDQYREAVTATFDDPHRGMNVAALVGLLRSLDVERDHPGFVVDEFLGRELAATIAGDQPLRLIAESTFHYADVVPRHEPDHDTVGGDDLDAGLAAGYQTVLPGWSWRDDPRGL